MRGRRARHYRLQATLRTLRRPFRPRTVTLEGRRLPPPSWSYNRRAGVLKVQFRLRSGALRVR